MNYFNAFIASFISFLTLAQAETYVIEMEPLEIASVPAVQSYSWGKTTDGKWVILGGRIDGLHQRQPFAAFLASENNTLAFVIDPVTEESWFADLSVLGGTLFEQLQATNHQFKQNNSTLYITGGYGYSATAADHITYPYLTAVDIDGLASAIMNSESIAPFFRQIEDANFKLTGGQMDKMDSTFYIAGGHLFDGRYNPEGPDHGPGFVQEYSNEIRSFKLVDDGVNLTVYNYAAVHDTVNLHRRDYNMAPQIFPDGNTGFTMFSGVFDYNDVPYYNSVNITAPDAYVTNNTFNQYLSQYQSAKLPIFDATANVMQTVFFGGLSQFTLNESNVLVEDIDVPFVKTISRIERDGLGNMSETDLGYIEMPALMGPGSDFIPTGDYYDEHGIIDLNAVPNERTLVGYIYGGIESSQPNIFFINDGSQSMAINTIFKVYINKSTNVGLNEEVKLDASNVLNLCIYPNPVRNKLKVNFFGVNYRVMTIKIFGLDGRIVGDDEFLINNVGKQEVMVNTSKLSEGTYIIKVSDGVYTDQLKFVKE